MSKPGPEIRWGKGFEDPRHRVRARLVLENSLGLVRDGLYHLNLSIDERTRLVVSKPPKKSSLRGETSTAKTSYLYFRPGNMVLTELNVIYVAATIIHEELHKFRRATGRPNTTLEVAATEGLAYNGEHIFGEFACAMLGKKSKQGVVPGVRAMPLTARQNYRRNFLGTILPLEVVPQEIHDQFTQEHAPGYGLSRAEIVGTDIVDQQLEAGEHFAEMMQLSAREVLAVA